MADKLNEQELQALFNRHMPMKQMPPEFAARLRQQVLAEVAQTLQTTQYAADNAEEAGFTPVTAEAVQPYVRQTPSRTAATREEAADIGAAIWTWFADRLRLAPSLAMAGATLVALWALISWGPEIFRPFNPGGEQQANVPQITTVQSGSGAVANETSTPTEDGAIATENGIAETTATNEAATPTVGPTALADVNASPSATEGTEVTSAPGFAIPTQPDMTEESTTEQAQTSPEAANADMGTVEPTDDGTSLDPVATATPRTSIAIALANTPTPPATTARSSATATDVDDGNLVVVAQVTRTPTLSTASNGTLTPINRTPTKTPTRTLTPSDGTGSSNESHLTSTPTRTPTRIPTVSDINVPEKNDSVLQPTLAAPFTLTPTESPSPTHTPARTPTVSFALTLLPIPTPTPTNTATPSKTPTKLPTATHTVTVTDTPTATPSNTAMPTSTPTNTFTPVPPTSTPTSTFTPVPPTSTPTSTFTPVPPTSTPTSTFTPVPPTSTPTSTFTPVPTNTPTPTDTPLPTATSTPTNSPPVVSPLESTIDEDTSATIALRSAIRDDDRDPLDILAVGQPQHGTVQRADGGIAIYTPSANYAGDDSFTYLVSDGTVAVEGLVSIRVNAVNDAPGFTNPIADPEGQSTEVGQEFVYSVAATDADMGDSLTITLEPTTAPSWLTVESTGYGQAQLKGTPGFEDARSYKIVVIVRDSAGAEDRFELSLEVISSDVTSTETSVNAAGGTESNPTSAAAGGSSTITSTGVVSGSVTDN